jgi:hypothetical protein
MTKRNALLLRILGLVLFAIGCAGAWWLGKVSRVPGEGYKSVQSGGTYSSDGFNIRAGGIVILDPLPGMEFGTIKKPNGSEEIAYLIYFKYEATGMHSTGSSSNSHVAQKTMEMTNAFSIESRTIGVTYKVNTDEARTDGKGESLDLNGKSFDLNQGRVFLIDLTSNAPEFHQKNLKLPPITTSLNSSQQLEKLFKDLRTNLSKQDPEIDAFFK